MTKPDGVVAVNRDLGIGAMRIMVPWRGQSVPSKTQQVYLHRIALTLALGQRVVFALYGRAACHARLGDVEEARSDLEAYVTRFPAGRYAARARAALER